MIQNLSQIIDTLNPAQRQAVEQVYGPVLVLAGPGTGKTHMLTTRVAHILEANVGAGAENILCLTFTESAAVEMRERLVKWIGAEAYKVRISTFHGFCQWVIEDNPSVFYPLIGEREVADDLQKALIYRKIIKIKKWKYFWSIWDDFVHQYDFLKAISDLKREELSPEKLRELIPTEKKRLEDDPDNFYKRKFKTFNEGDWKPQARIKIDQKIEKMYELAELWEIYEKELSQKGFYDFDDLINTVVGELKTNENLRLDLQEKFQWLFVDEYQDTNNSQNAILWQLTEGIDQPNIFVVGDDDQSIYRFQGASVENIIKFKKSFPQYLEVTLTQNYRSHQNILDTAYHSIAHNSERSNEDKRIIAQKNKFKSEKPGQIIQAELSSRMAEISFMVDSIRSHINTGIQPSEIAILVRKNKEIEELATELPKFGIPVSAQISKNIFENEAVRQLILMLELFIDTCHDEKFFDLLHSQFLGIDPHTLLKLSLDRERRQPLMGLLLKTPSEDKKLQKFFEFLINTRSTYHHLRGAVIAEKFLYESGLADFLTHENRLDDWQSIRKFISWIREQLPQIKKEAENNTKTSELNLILERIDLHRNLNIPIRPEPLPQDLKSVKIMTAHKSKGLEFEVILISGLEDKKWGNPRGKSGIALPKLSDQIFDENEEERRLFFVALTRAKSQIHLSYSQKDFGGRSKSPSIFWHEVPKDLIKKPETNKIEEKLQELLPIFFHQAEKTLTENEKDILRQRIKKFVWSASSLQTYLDCPRKFLYQNLYRFPRRPLPQLALGVSLHQALERFFKTMLQNKNSSNEVLLKEYEKALLGQNLNTEDFEKFLEHGKEILQNYYEQKLVGFSKTYIHGYELEYDFGKFAPMVENIRITGKMDKIVYLDEKRSSVKITDYKSGKPRSIVPGENYWRQLVFYDLLARQSNGLNWQIDNCEIEFLTPSPNGKLGTRSLSVTFEDREKVIKELKKANEAIVNLEFPILPNLERDKEIDYWQNFGK